MLIVKSLEIVSKGTYLVLEQFNRQIPFITFL